MGGLYALAVMMQRRQRRHEQVQLVRDRLTSAARAIFSMTVQLNDGTQMRFDTSMPLAPGDFVEADINGKISPANLLTSQRVVGVVVACELRLS